MSSTNKTTNIGLSQWQGYEYLQREDINSDHSILDSTIGNPNDIELLEELKGKSVVEMIKYLQSKVLKPESSLNVSLTTENPVESTINEVENGSGVSVEVNGKFRTNLMNKGALCNDLSYVRHAYNCVPSLEGLGIKATCSTNGVIYTRTGDISLDITKHYLIIALVKNNTSTDITARLIDGDNNLGSAGALISKCRPSETTLVARKFSPNNLVGFNSLDNCMFDITSENSITIGESFEYTDLLVEEITEEVYNSITVEDLKKYSFIVGVQPLANLHICCVGENLIPNMFEVGTFNGIGLPTADSTSARSVDFFPIKPNTVYRYANINSSFIMNFIAFYDKNRNFISGASPSPTHADARYCKIGYRNNPASDPIASIDNNVVQCIMVENIVVPTEYKSHVESKSNIEGWWGESDILHIESDGRVWEERINELVDDFGKSDWVFNTDYVGFKVVSMTEALNDAVVEKGIVKKYDGSLLVNYAVNGWYTDVHRIYTNNNRLYISISDTDSGWGEAYTPTTNEIKAYFNGWVMSEQDGSIYEAGDKYWTKRYQGIGLKGALSGVTVSVEGGSVTNLNECPTEKAYGDITEVYKLYYELAEPITRELTTARGISTHSGEKVTFSVASGIVEREKVIPEADDTHYKINYGIPDNPEYSPLEYKVGRFIKVIREVNGIEIDDTKKWSISDSSSSYGNTHLYQTVENFENSEIANYYVDYEILHAEYNNQQVNAFISYKQNTHDAINYANQAIKHLGEQQSKNTKELTELVAPLEWLEPTLLNGASFVDSSGYVRYSKDAIGEVTLDIWGLKATNGAVSFVMPDGYRPEIYKGLPLTVNDTTTIAKLDIVTSGNVYVYTSNISSALYYSGTLKYYAGR